MRFVLGQEDKDVYDTIEKDNSSIIVESHFEELSNEKVVDSSSRFGYYLLKSRNRDDLSKYMPAEEME